MSERDIGDRIRAAAPQPVHGLDITAVWARASRQRWTRLAFGSSAATVVILLLFMSPLLRPPSIVLESPPRGATATPAEPAHTPTSNTSEASETASDPSGKAVSGPPGVDRCGRWVPRVLPDGSDVGRGRPVKSDYGRGWEWGSGASRVVVVAANPMDVSFDTADGQSSTSTEVRGSPAAVVSIGDPGVGEVAVVWSDSGCIRTMWLVPGTAEQAARQYARRA